MSESNELGIASIGVMWLIALIGVVIGWSPGNTEHEGWNASHGIHILLVSAGKSCAVLPSELVHVFDAAVDEQVGANGTSGVCMDGGVLCRADLPQQLRVPSKSLVRHENERRGLIPYGPGVVRYRGKCSRYVAGNEGIYDLGWRFPSVVRSDETRWVGIRVDGYRTDELNPSVGTFNDLSRSVHSAIDQKLSDRGKTDRDGQPDHPDLKTDAEDQRVRHRGDILIATMLVVFGLVGIYALWEFRR